MIPESLSKLEKELREASAQNRYDAVDRLALDFGDAARREIAGRESGDPKEALEIAQFALDVLEWSRLITLAGRARTAAELREIPFLQKYLSGYEGRPPMIRIDG